MQRDTALVRMQEAVALWSVGQATAAELVSLGCELLVAGFDGMNLAMLAGVHARNADEDVPDLLEAALDDVGLRHYPAGSDAGLEATVSIMASRVLAGRMSPMDLATWAHSTIGHDRLPIAERLVDLDDMYDTLEYIDMTEQDLDNEILAEARRITAICRRQRQLHPPVPDFLMPPRASRLCILVDLVILLRDLIGAVPNRSCQAFSGGTPRANRRPTSNITGGGPFRAGVRPLSTSGECWQA
ncbi:hypothetical protein Abr02nite_45280 [Paractinoplanes brasiliensis]|nr:hypothetical protein Abr02nite_45280 [Actinoplanes brasiliensis]